MCNICKHERLFVIPNPCCCCTLRCGTLWICIISFFYGGVSFLLPMGAGIDFQVKAAETNDSSVVLDPDKKNNKYTEPLHYSQQWDFVAGHNFQILLHYGCNGLQVFSAAFVAFCIIARVGGFLNFIAGSLWLIFRVIITFLWTPFLYSVFAITGKDIDAVWKTYSIFVLINLIGHIYCFIVIRFYSMEAWDLWRYRPVTPELRGRKRTKPRRHQKNFKKGKPPKPTENLSDWRRAQRQQQIQEHFENSAIPVWRVHNDFILYGEDYRGLDPARHFAAWERLERTGILKLGEQEPFDINEMKNIMDNLDEDGNLAPKSQWKIVNEKTTSKSHTKDLIGHTNTYTSFGKDKESLKTVVYTSHKEDQKKSKSRKKLSTLSIKKKRKRNDV